MERYKWKEKVDLFNMATDILLLKQYIDKLEFIITNGLSEEQIYNLKSEYMKMGGKK